MANTSGNKTSIPLTCSEISALWSGYYQESLNLCFLSCFKHHLQDEDLIPLAEEAWHISYERLQNIKAFYHREHYPVPAGFTEGDVNLAAPPLFNDIFTLSYLYMMNRLSMINYSFIATSSVRQDVLDFFCECLHTSSKMYREAVGLMLSKGIYDRPPKMDYPDQIEYVQSDSFLSGMFGQKRTLNAVELSEIFFNVERNYFSVIIMLGFAQVIQDKKLRAFLLKGKTISEKQIELFNTLLMDEDFLGIVPMTMEVTDSTVSPFSDKLIVSMINALNAIDVTLISHALSVSLRTDLIANYGKIAAEVMLYAKDTFDVMVERQWLEQPPLAIDRDRLMKT